MYNILKKTEKFILTIERKNCTMLHKVGVTNGARTSSLPSHSKPPQPSMLINMANVVEWTVHSWESSQFPVTCRNGKTIDHDAMSVEEGGLTWWPPWASCSRKPELFMACVRLLRDCHTLDNVVCRRKHIVSGCQSRLLLSSSASRFSLQGQWGTTALVEGEGVDDNFFRG